MIDKIGGRNSFYGGFGEGGGGVDELLETNLLIYYRLEKLKTIIREILASYTHY